MSGWTAAPGAAVPPGIGIGPVPGLGMPYQPEHEEPERQEDLIEWAEGDAEVDGHRTTDELRRDAERTREQINASVAGLRYRLSIDGGAKARRMAITGPFAPARRHPFTVVAAAAGATTATLVGLKLARGRRKSAKRQLKAAEHRGKSAQRSVAGAKDSIIAAAAELPPKGRSALRRLVHH